MWFERIIKGLEKHKVSYAIVGGFAVALHGAVRGTIDLDIVIGLTEKSFVSAEKALREIGMEPRLPITGKEVFQFRREYIAKRNLIAWSFYNPRRPSEVVDIVITKGTEEIKVVTKKALGLSLRVASIEDLIEMKSKTGRTQDVEDIKALRRLL